MPDVINAAIDATLEANRVDLVAMRVHHARIQVAQGRIVAIDDLGPPNQGFPHLIPGLVDAHVHIESSMLVPSEFGRLAVQHGTVATVSDPHEIANVLGIEGINFMRADAQKGPLQILFGAPPCVPATPFESAGAHLDAADVDRLLAEDDVGYVSEMMNHPGVLAHDEDLLAKIAAAQRRNLPVDGHAPGLRGEAARAYAAAGITTDHECTTLPEAQEKIAAGMHILIREGSAARDLDVLAPLLTSDPESVMLCSDDKHPNDLVHGHINALVARAIALGQPPLNVLRAACLNPVRHYGLNLGLLQLGDAFDAVEVLSLDQMQVNRTWRGGSLVFEKGQALWPSAAITCPNVMAKRPLSLSEFSPSLQSNRAKVIVAHDGSLLTDVEIAECPGRDGRLVAAPEDDRLILACVNRYASAPVAIALIRGFGLHRGALASSVSHDSHNIIGVGASAEDLHRAMQGVMDAGGGIAVCDGAETHLLPLPVAGLMSNLSGEVVAKRYQDLDARAKSLGSSLKAPFMTLSFMALLVMPKLKLSDHGLFDGVAFEKTSLWA
jgi:adenine deaminase